MREDTKRDAINEYILSLNPSVNTAKEVKAFLDYFMKSKEVMQESIDLMNYHHDQDRYGQTKMGA